MLLPRNQDDDNWEDPRAELVRRLLEYQQVREVSDVLQRLEEERRRRFARTYLPAAANDPPPAPLALSLGELLAAVDRVLRIAREPHIHDVVPRALDVDGAIATVRAVLELRDRARWYDVVRPSAEPWEVLSALLALLELARRGELRLSQVSPFASVLITRESTGQAA
jgi:segregation and condensation protein A